MEQKERKFEVSESVVNYVINLVTKTNLQQTTYADVNKLVQILQSLKVIEEVKEEEVKPEVKPEVKMSTPELKK